MPNGPVSVAITQNENIRRAIYDALDFLNVEPIIAGKMVAIKPNDTWASNEDKTAVTQPDTLRSVIRYIRQYNPKEIIITGGSGAGETEDIFEIAGLMDVIQEENVEFFDHNKAPFEEIFLSYSPEKDVAGPQRSVMVNPRILEYETLIDLSQLKVHETATVTLGLKNIAMSFPAADYYGHPRGSHPERHHFFDDMPSFIASMAKRFPVGLSIIVGHPAMIGGGPIGGHTIETGIVIASTDVLAADVVGAKILGFNVDAVHHLWEAMKLGVGEAYVSHMNFPGMNLDEAYQAFTKIAYGKELSFEHA